MAACPNRDVGAVSEPPKPRTAHVSCNRRASEGRLEPVVGNLRRENPCGRVPGDPYRNRDRSGRKRPLWLPTSWRGRRRRWGRGRLLRGFRRRRPPRPRRRRWLVRRRWRPWWRRRRWRWWGRRRLSTPFSLVLHVDELEALLRPLDGDLEHIPHPGRIVLVLGDIRL